MKAALNDIMACECEKLVIEECPKEESHADQDQKSESSGATPAFK